MIGRWLIWRVGNGTKVKLGEEPWFGCGEGYRLPIKLINSLHENGYFFMSKVAYLRSPLCGIRNGN